MLHFICLVFRQSIFTILFYIFLDKIKIQSCCRGGKKCQQGQGLVEILDRVKRNNQQRMKICQKICTYSCLHSQFAFTFKMSVVAFWLQMFTSKYHQNQWLAQNTGLSNTGFYWEMNKDYFWSCSIFLVIYI